MIMNTAIKGSKFQNITNWTLAIMFMVLGVLNAFLVHIVPGLFYVLISGLYFPPTYHFIQEKLGFRIPMAFSLIFAFLILWATMAVGDLFEMFEAWMLH